MDERINEEIEIKQDASGAIVLLEMLEDALKKFDRLGLRFVETSIYATENRKPFIETDRWALRYAIEALRVEPKGEPRDSVIAGLEFLEDSLKKFDRIGLRFVEGMIYATEDLHPFIEADRWAIRYAIEKLKSQE